MDNTLRTDYSLDRQSDEVLWAPIPKQFVDGEDGEMTVLVSSHTGKDEEIFSVYAEQGNKCFGFTLGEKEVERFNTQAVAKAIDRVKHAVSFLGQHIDQF